MNRKQIKYVQIDDEKGVLYSANKESVLVPVDFIKTLKDIFENLVGYEGGQILIHKIGESLGRGYVNSLEAILKEKGVSDFSIATKLKMVCNAIFMESGWGRVKICSLNIKQGENEILIKNCPSIRLLKKTNYTIERGILAGVYNKITNKEINYEIEKIDKKKKEIKLKSKLKDKKQIKQEKLTLLSRKDLENKIKIATYNIIKEKEKVSAVINSLFDGLIMVNKESDILMINPPAEKFFEIKQKNVIGKNIKKVLDKKIYNILEKVIKDKKNRTIVKEIDIYCPPNKKQKTYLRLTAKAVLTDNEVIGYILVIHNITRSKIIEKMKNEFITVSAHQLRTPLSGVKWSLQMILNGEMGEINSEIRKYLKKTYQSNERMVRLVNDMLNVSRIEEGRFVYDIKPFLLLEVIEDIIASASILAKKKNIKIELKKTKKELPKIDGDFDKIKIALQNILNNAIKYSSKNEKVIIKVKEIKKRKKEYVQINIEDFGIGINERDQERVFSKFFRGENALRLQTEGSGLGLFVAKNIINAHQGEIWFKNKKTRGTIFIIKLPIN